MLKTPEDVAALVVLWRGGEKYISEPYTIGEVLLEHFIECQREGVRHSPELLSWIAECLDKLPRIKDDRGRRNVRQFIKFQKSRRRHSQELLAWMADEFEKLLLGGKAGVFKKSSVAIFRLSGQRGRPLDGGGVESDVVAFVTREIIRGMTRTAAVKKAANHFMAERSKDPERQIWRWLDEYLVETPATPRRETPENQ